MSAVVVATRRRSAVGLAAFGVAVANLGYAISFLIVRPHNADAAGTAASMFLTLAGLLAALLLVVYGCRLAVLSTHNTALVVSAALAGFVASPAWYTWLGLIFSREGNGG